MPYREDFFIKSSLYFFMSIIEENLFGGMGNLYKYVNYINNSDVFIYRYLKNFKTVLSKGSNG